MKKIISKKNKINIVITLSVYAIAVIALACIMLEGVGTFVGEWLNYPVVSSYLKKNYDDVECELISTEYVKENRTKLGVESLTKGYRYTYKTIAAGNNGTLAAGDTFIIESYNFSVIRDTIYTDYTGDLEIVEKLDDYILGLYKEYASEDGSYEPYALYTDLKVDIGKYETVEDLINGNELASCDQVLHVKGEKLSFDDYKETVAKIAQIYKSDAVSDQSDVLRPSDLQIFYYYTDDNGNLVMQYESEFRRFELLYTEDQIVSSSGINYKVEATAEEETKIKAYTLVKNIYIWVILGAVIILGSYWVIKRVRRLSRYSEKT